MKELNRELSIIEYQLNIPDAVLEVKHSALKYNLLCSMMYTGTWSGCGYNATTDPSRNSTGIIEQV